APAAPPRRGGPVARLRRGARARRRPHALSLRPPDGRRRRPAHRQAGEPPAARLRCPALGLRRAPPAQRARRLRSRPADRHRLRPADRRGEGQPGDGVRTARGRRPPDRAQPPRLQPGAHDAVRPARRSARGGDRVPARRHSRVERHGRRDDVHDAERDREPREDARPARRRQRLRRREHRPGLSRSQLPRRGRAPDGLPGPDGSAAAARDRHGQGRSRHRGRARSLARRRRHLRLRPLRVAVMALGRARHRADPDPHRHTQGHGLGGHRLHAHPPTRDQAARWLARRHLRPRHHPLEVRPLPRRRREREPRARHHGDRSGRPLLRPAHPDPRRLPDRVPELLGLRARTRPGRRRDDHRPGGRARAGTAAPARERRAARRAAPDGARQHGARAGDRPGRRRRRRRLGGPAADGRDLLRAEPRRHLRDHARRRRSGGAHRPAQRARRADPRDRTALARIPQCGHGRARQPATLAAQRRPGGLHRVGAPLHRSARDGAGARRRRDPGRRCAGELAEPPRQPGGVLAADQAGPEARDLPDRLRRPDGAQPDQRDHHPGRRAPAGDDVLPQRPHPDEPLQPARLPARPADHGPQPGTAPGRRLPGLRRRDGHRSGRERERVRGPDRRPDDPRAPQLPGAAGAGRAAARDGERHPGRRRTERREPAPRRAGPGAPRSRARPRDAAEDPR
ncbi:MAG: hypothetical protein AVDCRST_MAG30-2297, partial [uncultured Solirubrobacteraceae bacterium]